MPAGIFEHDNNVYRKERAWHGLGTVIQDDLSAVEAAEQYGLCHDVRRWNLEAVCPETGKRLAFGSHKANVRVIDTPEGALEHILGVVGSGYQICQNRELAEWTDALAQTGKVVIESAGTLFNGKKVWFLARGESFKLGGSDEVFPYVCVSNAHDGSGAIRVTPTTVRVVCVNTLHMVIPSSEGQFDQAAIVLRHTGDLGSKLQAAKAAIRNYEQILSWNREKFDRLADSPIDDAGRLAYFADRYAKSGFAIATQEELSSSDEKIRRTAELRAKRMDDAAADFLKRYESEREKLAAADSVWLAMNAFTGYLQHSKGARGKDDAARVESRLNSNLFGINASRSVEAFEAALTLAG